LSWAAASASASWRSTAGIWPYWISPARREVAGALGQLELGAQSVQRLADLRRLAQLLLLRLPARGDVRRLPLQLGQLGLEVVEPLFGGGVRLLAQRLALDLELHHSPVDLVQRLRLAVHRHPHARGRLVHQVDRLVRQEPVRDVPVRQGRRRHDRAVADPDPVVNLVLLLQPTEDRNRVLDTRLAHHHRLKPPRQRRVLLHVLPILVERRGADAVQLAARQGRLDHVGGVHAPVVFPAPTRVCISSMKRTICPRRP
jgi:hypothetical protein